jgi:hypothetical protein
MLALKDVNFTIKVGGERHSLFELKSNDILPVNTQSLINGV